MPSGWSAGFTTGVALVIGVDGPQGSNSAGGFFGSTDASEIADALTSPSACAYPPERLTVLVGEQATTRNIVSAFDALARNAGPEDTVFIFLAAPGTTNTDGVFALQTADTLRPVTSKGDGPSPFTGAVLTEKVRALPGHRVFVCVSTSRTWGAAGKANRQSATRRFSNTAGQNPPADLVVALALAGVGRVILSAATGSQLGLCEVPRGISLFGEALTRVLHGEGSEDAPGYLGAFAVAGNVYEEVAARSGRDYGVSQTPSLVLGRDTIDFALGLRRGQPTPDSFQPATTPPKGSTLVSPLPADATGSGSSGTGSGGAVASSGTETPSIGSSDPRSSSPATVDVPALQRVLSTYFTPRDLLALWPRYNPDGRQAPEGVEDIAASLISSAANRKDLSTLEAYVRGLRPAARYELSGTLNRARLARILERLTEEHWMDTLYTIHLNPDLLPSGPAWDQATAVLDYVAERGGMNDLIEAVERAVPASAFDSREWVEMNKPRTVGAGPNQAAAPGSAFDRTSAPGSAADQAPAPGSAFDRPPPQVQPLTGPPPIPSVAAVVSPGDITPPQRFAKPIPTHSPIPSPTPIVVRAFRVDVPAALVRAVDRPAAAIDTHTLDIHIGPTRAALEAEQNGVGPAALGPLDRRAYRTVMQLREDDGQAEQRRLYEGPLDLAAANGAQALQKRLTGDVDYGKALHHATFNDSPLPHHERVTNGAAEATDPLQPTLGIGYQWALARSTDPMEVLRVQLRIDNAAPELHALRWEYLWDATPLGALACNARTPFARVLHVAAYEDNHPRRISRDSKMRVLLVLASPQTDDAAVVAPAGVDLARLVPIRPEELEAVKASLAGYADVVTVVDQQVSLSTLRETLRAAKEDEKKPFHVVHLICHGVYSRKTSESYLVLHAQGASHAEAVPDTAVAKMFSDFKPELRLIVLASCQTALGDEALTGVARRLVAEAEAPAVVAMQGLLEFAAAQHFAQRLYERLANSGEIDVAVNAARQRLYDLRRLAPRTAQEVGQNQWGIPVLFMRVPDGRLFTIEDAPYRQAAAAPLTRASTYSELRNEPELPPEPTPPQEAPRLAVFADPSSTRQRWALIQCAQRYRHRPGRRVALFLRGLARERIADLLRDVPAAGPDERAYRGSVIEGGAVTLGGQIVDGVLGPGNEPGTVTVADAAARPRELGTSEVRHSERGFRPDPADDDKIDQAEPLVTTGNLTWLDVGLAMPAGPPTGAVLDALRNNADVWQTFAALTESPADSGLDERTASVILHADRPDLFLPFHAVLADRVLANLALSSEPRYARGFAGYCALAEDLLRDDALGFESLVDVAFFLQRLGAGYEQLHLSDSFPSDLRPPLARPALRAADIDGELVFRASVIEQAVTALNAGKHIILIGPPGTGKTTLAEDLCRHARDLDCNRGHALVTATADWTTFDTIGGYMPAGGERLAFKPGVFLEAIENQQWLIIDEINRADIDKAFGELFTVLSGQPVTLPYRDGARPVRILPPGHPALNSARDYVIHPSWRVIGTMNVYDKASLFSMSFAFMRRFAFVDVPVPGRETYQRLIEFLLRKRGLLKAEDRLGAAHEALRTFASLLDTGSAGPNALMRYRSIGPAIASDILRYVALRCSRDTTTLTLAHMAEAVSLYLAPQLDGLDQPRIEAIRDFLTTLLPVAGSRDLYGRLNDMYPHLNLGGPQT